jgi:exosortase
MSRFEIVLVAAMGVVWIPGLLALAEVWNEVEYASHGFLVPFVALWAATAHRQRLAELAPRPVRGGLYWIGLSLVAYLIALIVGSATLIGLVLVIGVGVVVIGLRGIEWMRTLTFPLAYLLFMVPLPSSWVTPLIVRLQMLVSGLAVWILQAVGVPIYRSGNVLELPGGATLFVAEACSGITSLITLIPIGVFIAYFTESRLLRRLIRCV